MKSLWKMSHAEEFGLWSYLAADLRRARVLLHGTADGVAGLRLWGPSSFRVEFDLKNTM